MDLLDHILQETKNKMQNMHSSKRATITNWLLSAVADMMLCLVLCWTGASTFCLNFLITFVKTYVNKLSLFLDVFPEDEFCL
jgi:hypothetical protein